MDVTRRNTAISLSGLALLIAGLTWWFGPAALAASGLLLLAAGLLMPTEGRK
jgi:hypothetical protein